MGGSAPLSILPLSILVRGQRTGAEYRGKNTDKVIATGMGLSITFAMLLVGSSMSRFLAEIANGRGGPARVGCRCPTILLSAIRQLPSSTTSPTAPLPASVGTLLIALTTTAPPITTMLLVPLSSTFFQML